MAEKIDKTKLPRRTREHIIASQSQNYVEKFFIDKGHTAERPHEDYGTDLLVKTFDEEGYLEPGNIELQLKATETCRFSRDGSYISFRIEVKHYNAWKEFPMPMFLVLCDMDTMRAYWLYLQDYFSTKLPRKNAKYIRLRVPTENVLTPETVDYMRDRKAIVVEQIQKGVKHEG